MELWVSLPWKEMLLACTFFVGIGLFLFLIISKYPASRYLGLLIVSYLFVIIIFVLEEAHLFLWLAIGLVSFSLKLYSSSFFTQNTRVRKGSFIIMMILSVVLLTHIFFPFHWSLRILATALILFQTIGTSKTLNTEGDARGIRWFQNPGARLSWFKFFWLMNVLLIIGITLGIEYLTVELLAIFSLLISMFVYTQIFSETTFVAPIPLGNKYKKSTLNPAIKASILKKLEGVMSEKFYLRDDATLSNLAVALKTTTHHLSQVLNESKGISFQELISQYRIREARSLLRKESNRQVKVENIAAMVGYNSKSAFNTAFKKFSGVTPSEYRSGKEVQTYREAHLPERKVRSDDRSTLSLNYVLSLKLKLSMVANFIKVFIRNLKRNKIFTLINLFGLTIGFTCSILIYLFISDELSFDTSIPRSEDIYRIAFVNENPQTRTPHPMAQAMARDWPEVETAVTLSPWYGPGLSKQNIKIENVETNIALEIPDCFFADSTFFEVFDLEVVAGDRDALKKPNTIVITEKIATLFFGDEDPIGKNLSMSDMPLEVAAVVKGMPKNAHFHFSILLSYVTIKQISPENNWYTWGDFGHFNYIKMVPQSDHIVLAEKIPKWVVPFLKWEDSYKEKLLNGEVNFILQPIRDIHLTSNLRWELEKNGNVQYVHILTGVWIFILLIVSINYINLTTAKSMERAKEIGVRKTLGAISSNMAMQFYLESLIFSLIALIFGFVIALLLLDSFNYLSDKSFMPSEIFSASLMLKGVLLSVIIGLVSGYYPAAVLSGFKPSDVLKGKFSFSAMGTRLRGLLVVVQFSVSAILIASSLIVLNQIGYMKSKPLGFDQNQVISIPMQESVEFGGFNVSQIRAMQDEMRSVPGVKHVSLISNLPGGQFNQNSMHLTDNPSDRIDVSEMYVDFGIEQVLDLKIAKGRGFDHTYSSDSSGISFLVNESAVKKLNLTDPIGKSITWDSDPVATTGKIIGVIKDFHYKSLHEPIQPMIVKVDYNGFANLIVKVEGNQFQKTMTDIKTVYEKFESETPMNAKFLDQQLEALYAAEDNTLNIFSFFTAVAIFLACLGLLAMAMALLSQKVKEIGVRKILGASAQQIMQMIFFQFAKLIVIALAIGLPLALYLMQNWMGMFSYQAPLGLMPFIGSAAFLLAVALLSVSVVVFKIAFTNPIHSLRYE
jgi:putative ABC transport system permease protein